MFHNVGRVDRFIRLSLALILVILYYLHFAQGALDNYFIAGAIFMAVTSLRQCCPIYALLGFGTCGVNAPDKKPIIEIKKIKLR